MLGAKDDKQFACNVNKGYLCTDNVIRVARVNQFNQIALGEDRLRIRQRQSNPNQTAFANWLIAEMRELPPGLAKNHFRTD
jgi:hypothetical protein